MSFDFDEFADLLDQPSEKVENLVPLFTVSGFVETANQIFETAAPLVMIEGEVSSFKINQGKYVFFDLKDKKSTLPCFMMLYQMRLPLEDGMRVVATVRPKITDWGKFSLTVVEIKPQGEGELKKSFEILKKKLEAEGLFDQSKKQSIPVGSKNIAVISSTQAAGYADFIKILNQRWGGARVRVAHTQVQGASAANQIASAIEYFNNLDDKPEVIAVIRGGGSAEDLASFNEEVLVHAIFNSKIPIITGIGHEIDDSLADLAADLAAATPSHVAQILTPDRMAEIEIIRSRIIRAGDSIVSKIGLEISNIAEKRESLMTVISESIADVRAEISSKRRLLENLNPESVLKKGYAIVRGVLSEKQEIEIELFQKIIKAEVKNVREK
ncbi:MAG: exodeoxyribonuclease VII large subunit [bacterium]|nr:exodeoxyribonuclease VII large subunit [bacterium]